MSSSTAETTIRRQLLDVFGRAEYPVTELFALIPVLPDGPATTFEVGDVCLGAMELGMGYAECQDYPYQAADGLVADLMAGLRDDSVFE